LKSCSDRTAALARTIREETPQQLKFPYALWTLSLIGELIRRRLNKSLTPASVLRVMTLLGFTAQKPLYRAWQRDPVLVQKWQEEQYPQIRKEAREHGARIYFADEPGLRSDYHLGITWAPAARTPVIEKTGRRFSVNMLWAPRVQLRCAMTSLSKQSVIIDTGVGTSKIATDEGHAIDSGCFEANFL